MPMSQFSVGDVVQLKSGGPIMTITEIGSAFEGGGLFAWCTWFKSSNEPETKHFPLPAIKLVDQN